MRAAPKTVQEISAVKPKLLSTLGAEGPSTPYPLGIEGVFVDVEAVLENSIVAVVVASVTVSVATPVDAEGTAGPYPENRGKIVGKNMKAVAPTATMKLRISVSLST